MPIKSITRNVKLKSGSLFWPDRLPAPPPRHPPLENDIRCDVAVIGAGLTGAMAGRALARKGFDVVFIDKRDAGQGSTSASTALVQYEIDTPLFKLIRSHGAADAIASYRCCLNAIFELRALARELGGGVEFRERPSLYLASKADDVPDLEKEFRARRSNGFAVEFLEASELKESYSLRAPAAIWSAHAAEVNPLQLTLRLIQSAKRLGARVFGHTTAMALAETKRGVAVTTDSGAKIHARHAVVATGYETDARATGRRLKLKSTYVMVTRPLATPFCDGCPLIWETARPYVYIRPTIDNRLMIGGADEPFVDAAARDRLLPRKMKVLHRRLKALFPEIRSRPSYSWTGPFGESADGLPFIGRTRPGSRIFHALCYGANGTNFAVIAADILGDALCGRRNARARLFAFDR